MKCPKSTIVSALREKKAESEVAEKELAERFASGSLDFDSYIEQY